MKRNKTVEEFTQSSNRWKEEISILRSIIVENKHLDEGIKWGFPVYSFKGKNVLGIGDFKSYFGIWFFQGALINDRQNKLINAQSGKTKAMRQWRFTSVKDIDKNIIQDYISESIDNFKNGKEIKAQRKRTLEISPYFNKLMSKDPTTKKAFDAMTIGRQRAYVEYIDTAKRLETKKRRWEKIVPMIHSGQGLNDKYL